MLKLKATPKLHLFALYFTLPLDMWGARKVEIQPVTFLFIYLLKFLALRVK